MLTVYTVTCRVITTAITKTGKHRARFGANVITLNINRIVQDWANNYKESMDGMDSADMHIFYAPTSGFKNYLEAKLPI